MKKDNKFHIGQTIEEVFKKSGMSKAEFAKALNNERTNAYAIFKNKNINVTKLVEVSKILNHNFLYDVMEAEGLNPPMPQTEYSIKIDITHINADKIEKITSFINDIQAE